MLSPVVEPSKARVCGQSLTGVTGSNLCCVCRIVRTKAKTGQSGQRSTVKAQNTKKNPARGMGVCVVRCQKRQKAKCRTIEGKEPSMDGVQIKHKRIQKKSRLGHLHF